MNLVVLELLQISVGRMEFDPERAKGILDKSFASVKVPIHKDSSAASMLQKC